MKKTLALVLALTMILSVMGTVALGEGEKRSLNIWIPTYQFGDGISDADFWNGIFENFEKENNCEVNIEIQPWGDYNTTVYTGLINNDGADVIYVTDTYDLVKADLLLGLDSYFTEEEIKNYMYWDLAPLNAAGEHCTIPMADGAVMMFYNKDILAAAGVEVPTTWDEFIECCKIIKEKCPDVLPFLQNWGANTGTSALMTSFWPYYFQAGGEVVDAEGNVAINNEAGLKTLEFIKRLYDEGIFDESITAETTAVDKFTDGKLAFTAVGDGKSADFVKAGLNWGYIFSLKGPAGYGSRTACDSFGVASKTKERGNDDLAVKALKLITCAATMDAFHSQVYALPKITYDATYIPNAEFDATYTEYASSMKIVSEFEGKTSFEKTLQSNIQMMFMGDLTPQEVLDETMTYYAEQIKQ